jgi:alpha-tubulin suppressor-like RCC1 family protein
MLYPNGVRATGIQFRIAASGCCSTSTSNIVDIIIPPCPPPPPTPTPPVGRCLPSVDLYGYTAIAAFDPYNCDTFHSCDRAIFDLYLNDIFIGQSNLNNGNDGGPRSGVFTINDHIGTNNLKISLKCASPNNQCHQGIGRVILISPLGQIIYAECLPNDVDVFTGDTCCVSGLYKTGLEDSYNLYAFGSNNNDQLGLGYQGLLTYITTPTKVSGEGPWKSVSMGVGHALGIKNDNTLWAWGSLVSPAALGIPWNLELGYPKAETPVQVSGGGQWKSVSAGDYHTLGIKNDNTLWAWGYNKISWAGGRPYSTGFLGIGNIEESYIPIQISGEWKSVSAGNSHSLGIKNDNTLWAWGDNISGQLGVPNSPSYTIIPVEISGGGQWKSISAGYIHSLGIKNDDTLWAWGNNVSGQLGIGNTISSSIPVQVTGQWKSVSAGSFYSLGIKNDNTLWAWGDNISGQLGVPNSPSYTIIPVEISGGGQWKSISAGYIHSLGIKIDDTLWAWGDNNLGQLGVIEPYTPYSVTPIKVNDSKWSIVSAKSQNSISIQDGLKDQNWYISALPTGVNPPESLPYNAYIYDPSIQNPPGFPSLWNSFSSLLPDSKWIGPFESINSVLQVPYSIIYSSNMYAASSGLYTLNLIAYADNEISGFIDGEISNANPYFPTITGGTPIIFDNIIDGLCSSSFSLSNGNHKLSLVVRDNGGSIGLLTDVSGCFQAGPIATLSTPTGFVTINSNGVNLNNAPNTDFPNDSYFQISQQEGNTNFVNSPSLVIKPLKVPLTIEFNNTNGGGCGQYTAKIVRYVGNNYWGGMLNTALIAQYINAPINNLPTENYSVSLTGMNESIRLFCTARDPEVDGFCIGTSLFFNLKIS